MANSNVNIGQRLFAYIEHSADVNTNITEQYKNSLLFIGDQQQIYVPAMQTYVGIGMTAYNNTLTVIQDVNNRITQLAGDLESSMVKKIYANYNDVDLQTIGLPEGANAATYMTQEITIKGINDYDPTTGRAISSYVISGDQYIWKPGFDPSSTTVNVDQDPDKNYYATSGITITSRTVPATVDATGAVTKPVQNYIEIDDKLTWSYIASAYTYTLNWARQYVSGEIGRVYNNLLGVQDEFIPADYETAIITANENMVPTGVATVEGSDPYTLKYINPTSQYYYKQICDASADGAIKHVSPEGTKYYTFVEYTGIANVSDAVDYYTFADGSGIPTLYYRNPEYNGTYNINITDGINTLKEVAYLFDVMTDGLGTPYYITKAEYDTLTDEQKGNYFLTFDENASNSNAANVNEKYAYRIEYDAENLGIQMAYSLNTLKNDINDVHYQTGLLENGETTLRSILVQGSKFMNVKTEGSTNIVPTDQNNSKGRDNYITYYYNGKLAGELVDSFKQDGWSGASYVVGDANVNIQLKYTQTYITSQVTDLGAQDVVVPTEFGFNAGDYKLATTEGVEYIFKKADLLSIDPNVEYYKIANDEATLVPAPNTNPHTNGAEEYWFIPDEQAKYGNKINSNVIYVSKLDVINGNVLDAAQSTSGDGNYYYGPLDNASMITADDLKSKDDNWYTANKPFVVSSFNDVVVHPVIENTDAIATAEWTNALVSATVHDVEASITDVLSQANKYTDDKIAELDSNSLYSDFETNVWDPYTQSVAGQSLTPGTDTYKTTKQNVYDYYRTGDASYLTNVTNDATIKTASSISDSLVNRSKSEYVVNVVEENGIVTTETKELPAAYITANYEIWGEQNSSAYKRVYTQLDISTLTDDKNSDPTIGSGNAQKLFAFVANDTLDNALYVKDTTKSEYRKLESGEYDAGKSVGTYYYYDQNEGKYDTIINAIAVNKDFTQIPGDLDTLDKISGANGGRFIQVYEKVDYYAECDLETIKWDGTYTTITSVVAEGVEYTNPTFYYVESVADVNKSTKYITADYQHLDYTSGNHGENNLDVTIHLTHIEDASRDNTGLADAYDVKEYIDNMFNWVNLSASIDANNIETNAAWYTQLTYSDVWDDNAKQFKQLDCYVHNGTKYVATTFPANPALIYNDGVATLSDATKYYTRTQEEYINPINLTITKYNKKVYEF